MSWHEPGQNPGARIFVRSALIRLRRVPEVRLVDLARRPVRVANLARHRDRAPAEPTDRRGQRPLRSRHHHARRSDENAGKPNLLRHKSGRYYARAFAGGKEVWQSLKTSHYSVAEAKNQLPKLINRALMGEEVVITRRGKPVVELKQIQSRPPASKAIM